jgi:chromosome segregation ATPase
MGIFTVTKVETVGSVKPSRRSLQRANKRLEKEIAALKPEMDLVKDDGKKLYDNYNLALQRNTVLEKALQDTTTGKKDGEAKIAALEQALLDLDTAIQATDSQREAAETEVSSLKTRLENLNAKLEKRPKCRSSALEAENIALKHRVEQLESTITAGTAENKNLKKKLEGAELRSNSILKNNNINHLQRRIKDTEAQLQKLRGQKDSADNEIKDLKRKLNGTSWQAGTRQEEKNRLESQNAALEHRVHQAESELQLLRDERERHGCEVREEMEKRDAERAELRLYKAFYQQQQKEMENVDRAASGAFWQREEREMPYHWG